MSLRSFVPLFAALTAVAPTRAAAQQYRVHGPQYAVDKGAWLAGGSVSFEHSTFDVGGHLTQFSVSPFGGYFVAPGLAILLDAGITRVTDGDHAYADLSFGPGLRYYFGRRARKVYPFLGIAAERLWRLGDPTPLGQSPLASASSWIGEGGAALMVSRDISVTGTAYYEATSFKYEGAFADGKTKSFGLSFGFGIFLF